MKLILLFLSLALSAHAAPIPLTLKGAQGQVIDPMTPVTQLPEEDLKAMLENVVKDTEAERAAGAPSVVKRSPDEEQAEEVAPEPSEASEDSD